MLGISYKALLYKMRQFNLRFRTRGALRGSEGSRQGFGGGESCCRPGGRCSSCCFCYARVLTAKPTQCFLHSIDKESEGLWAVT